MRHLGYDVTIKDGLDEHVFSVRHRISEIVIGTLWEAPLFDKVDQLGEADRRDRNFTSRSDGLFNEVSRNSGETRVIEQIPNGSVRIGDGSNH